MSAWQNASDPEVRLDLPASEDAGGRETIRRSVPTGLTDRLAAVAAAFHILIQRYTREGDSLVRVADPERPGVVVGTRLRRDIPNFAGALEAVESQLRSPDRHPGSDPAVYLLRLMTDDEDDPRGQGLSKDRSEIDLAVRSGAEPEIRADFDTDRIGRPAAARLLEHLENLLASGLSRPHDPVGKLALMSEDEYRRIIDDWSGRARSSGPDASVPRLFADQVVATPEAVAVEAGDRILTYTELDQASDQVAAGLASRGVVPGSIVGVALQRSAELVTALLGVLKAGAAYLPLDAGYPDARLADMLDDAVAPLIIVDGSTVSRLSRVRVPANLVEVAELSRSGEPAPEPPDPTPADLAYLIYTSGSTGRPKGVRALHRGITRLVRGQDWIEVGPGSRVMAFAPISFDAATFEIWTPLLNGGTVVMAPPRRMTAADLGRFIESAGVDTCWLTAALFHQMVAGGVHRLQPLRQLLTGGDIVSPEHARRALEAVPGLTLVNGYGPTENTTFTTCHPMHEPGDVGQTVSIGRPISSTTVYVLDPSGNPVPTGVPGELHTGGTGVADGYLGRPQVTAERFLPDPFEAGGRLYRTGDLVRWREDGTLDFLGRIDVQVKVDGFRIEPGEIEAHLIRSPQVRDVAVRARGEPGHRRLVAWVVPATPTAPPSPADLREHCASGLPRFMVPTRFELVDELPLTPNGKLDEAALPVRDHAASGRAFLQPGPGTGGDEARFSAALTDLWQRLLGVREVDPDAGFFELGGSSLLGLRLLDEISGQFGVEMPVATFYRHPTIHSMARWLAGAAETGTGPGGAALSSEPSNQRPESETDRRIAVIGMAARVPGASDVDALWEMLSQGRDGRVEYEDAELRAAGVPDERIADPDYVKAGYPLDEALAFDADFFGMLPREVELMDPQQRLFLELAWSAVEYAGYAPRDVPGRVGVFGGVGRNSYLINNLATRPELQELLGEHPGLVGNLNDFPTTHVSFRLGFDGPSVNVQTACSTSGVAVHLASRSLLDGECDFALAGGCKILVPHDVGYRYTEGGALSAGGRIRAFDSGADGMVRGSGGAMLLLKRYADAVADGDEILGVILGSATNNDGGHRAGFAAPSPEGQARVIETALGEAGVSADSIDYVEAHGTGTILGDPIEVEGLTLAYRRSTQRRGFCGLGSIKSSIGHLDAGATAAGIVKVLLAFRHEQLPPTANYRAPNPHIDFGASPFFVVDEARSWPRSARPRRAGVSSFGLGGSNAHLILEEPPGRWDAALPDASGSQLLVLSARTGEALERATSELADHLQTHEQRDMGDLARTLQVGRHRFPHRRTVAVADRSDAIELLRKPSSPRVRTVTDGPAQGHPVFLFPGQGTQHVGMGEGLYQEEAVYRAVVDRSSEILREPLGDDLRDVLYSADRAVAERRLLGTDWAQPALIVHQVATVELLASWGIVPAAVAGHSIGEFAAAVTTGVMDLEDALHLVAARGRLMYEQPGGSMAAVPLSEEELEGHLQSGVSIAAVNGPRSCVVSGPRDAVTEVLARLEAKGHEARPLHTSHAFHSPMMEPVVDAFEDRVRAVELAAPSLPFVSTVTGTKLSAEEARDPGYWADQLRRPVRFAGAVESLTAEGHSLFLDVGPASVAATLARAVVPSTPGAGVLSAARHPSRDIDDRLQLLDAVGGLWAHGVQPDWAAIHGDRPFRRVPLPTYPFERSEYVIQPSAPVAEPPASFEPSPDIPSTPSEEPFVAERTPADRVAVLTEEIRSVLFELSGLEPATLDAQATFLELGFDSLFLAQVGGALRKRCGIRVGVRTLLDGAPSIDALARHLDQELPADAFRPEGVEGQPVVDPAGVPRGSGTAAPWASTVSPEQLQGLAGVMQQQLELMQQQLALITGTGLTNGAAAPPTPPVANPTPSTSSPPSPIPPTTSEPERTHGPWRPLQRSTEGLDERRRAAIEDLVQRVNRLTAGSKEFMARNRQALADPRSVVGFRSEWKELVYQIVVERAEGGTVWDVDGNAFVDVVGAFGANFLGHSPEYVTNAVRKELDSGFTVGPQTALAGDVARLVSELTGMERVALCNTGSEAVLAALRICRTVRGRDRVACFSGHYHGIFDEVLVKAVDVAGVRKNFPVAPGIPQGAVDRMLVLDYGDPAALDVIREHAEELACVLLEPVRSRNPDLQPVAFVRELRELTRELGLPLVFDEMVTGFRTHPGGAQAAFGVRADLATYGKALGGGYPVGVVAGSPDYMDALDGGAWQFGDDSMPEADMTWFAGTFVRHPIAMAAARASLQYMRDRGPELQESLNARTASWVAGMNHWFDEHDVPMHFEHFSSFFLPTWTCHQDYADLLTHFLLTRGVFAREQRPLFWSVAHTEDDWEAVARGYRESLLEMQAAGLLTDRRGDPVSPGPEHAPYLVDTPERRLPLTEPQREVWMATRLGDDASASFNLSLRFSLRGELDVAAMRRALQSLVDRHEALRATFDDDGETQAIASRLELEVPHHDLSGEEPEEASAAAAGMEHDEVRRSFDLAQGPLVRARILQLSRDEWRVLLTVHHIVADGWACGILARDLGTLYAASVSGERPHLNPVMSLGDYVRHLQRDEERELRAEAESFWRRELDPVPEPLMLPTDRPRPAEPSYAAGHLRVQVDPDDLRRVQSAAAELGVTFFSYALAAFDAYVHRITGQEDVVVGFDLAGQSLVPGRDLVCHAVNFLPLRVAVDGTTPFSELVSKVRGTLFDVIEHQRMTYGGLLRLLHIRPDPSRRPLISVSFNLDPGALEADFGELEATVDSLPRGYETNDVFLNLVQRGPDQLEIQCTFNEVLFDQTTMERRLAGYLSLLGAAGREPDTPVGKLPVLGSREAGLLDEWSQGEFSEPDDATLHELVAQQAAATPDVVAVSSPEAGVKSELSFGELEWRSDALAVRLQDMGVGPGTRVAVSMHRSVELVVSLLAVLKAGGAYVPVDPAYPRPRREWMLADSGSLVVLTQRALADHLPGHVQSLAVDAVWDELVQGPSPVPRAGADDLAYVIYTSGSTGQPKGAMVEHRSIVNRIRWMQELCDLGPSDVVLQKTPASFDVSVWEFFLPLVSGAHLRMAAPDRQGDAAYLVDLIRRAGVTTLHFVPSMLTAFLEREEVAELDGIRRVVCSGEALPAALRDRFLSTLPDTELWNLYGPTEAAVDVSAHRCRLGQPEETVPIGRPVANTTLHVLDPCKAMAPVGVPGELYIGGVQVGRGYLGREALTEERFLPDPFRDGGRLYRTGDRVRWSPAGEIEFLGRLDQQVKIRGFRVELGEIEATLRELDGVRDAVVTAPELQDGDRTLVAYLVGESTADPEALRQKLAGILPGYMVPTRWVELDEIPLTANGKVDRARLPRPESTSDAGLAGRPPASETEKVVAGIWCEILGLDAVMLEDDFFALGGHSIMATRVVARIRTDLGVEVPLRRLFGASRLGQFCEEVELRRLASAVSGAAQTRDDTRTEEVLL